MQFIKSIDLSIRKVPSANEGAQVLVPAPHGVAAASSVICPTLDSLAQLGNALVVIGWCLDARLVAYCLRTELLLLLLSCC